MCKAKDQTVTISLKELKNTCFVIMPFATAMDRVYEKVFRIAIERAQLVPERGDEIYGHRRVMADIWQSIRSAQCVLAELTGKNANVLYELGLCHALGKPVIIVTGTLDDVPFDLRDLRCIVYDKNQPDWGELLQTDITETLRVALAKHDPRELLQDVQVSAVFPTATPHPPAVSAKAQFDLSGEWKMEETYEDGRTSALLDLQQTGNELRGIAVITDRPSGEKEFIIKQSISGVIDGVTITLEGTSFQIVKGSVGRYNLDKWQGHVKNTNSIEGSSADHDGTSGRFKMTRVKS